MVTLCIYSSFVGVGRENNALLLFQLRIAPLTTHDTDETDTVLAGENTIHYISNEK